MTNEAGMSPEFEPQPNPADRYFQHIGSYILDTSTTVVGTEAIADNPMLQQAYQELLDAGTAPSVARLLIEVSGEIEAVRNAHRNAMGTDRLLLEPALTYLGLSMGKPGPARRPEVTNFNAFMHALNEAQPQSDQHRQELLSLGLTIIAYQFTDDLAALALTDTEYTIEEVLGEDVPEDVLRAVLPTNDIENNDRERLAKGVELIPDILPRLETLGASDTPINELKLFMTARQEGLLSHWAVLKQLNAFTLEDFMGTFSDPDTVLPFVTVIDRIRNQTHDSSVFLEELRQSIATSIHNARQWIHDAEEAPTDATELLEELVPLINAVFPPVQ
jgi:hypothetical protein